MVRCMDAIALTGHLVEQLGDRAIVSSGIGSREEHTLCSVTGNLRNRRIGGRGRSDTANILADAGLIGLDQRTGHGLGKSRHQDAINVHRLDLLHMRAEVDFLFLHVGTIGGLNAEARAHLLFHVRTVTDRGGVRGTDIGDLGADVLADIFGVHTTIVAARYRNPEHPLTTLLGDLRIGRMRDHLRHTCLCRHIDDRQRHRRAGRTDQKVDLLLEDKLVRVGNALVGLALVIHQRGFDHVAIDATGIIDRLDLVHDHLAIGLTVFTDHPHRDADTDVTSESSSGGKADTCGHNASKHFVQYSHVFLHLVSGFALIHSDHTHYAFTFASTPNRPDGLNIRTRINSKNA